MKPIQNLKSYFTQDFIPGFMVFLLALPLSLGIAKASDFPAITGILTAIIGGILVTFFSGAPLTIKGPAAGLIVIASGAVTEFGGGEAGWRLALATIVVAGIIQILFGLLKFGKLSELFPIAAIHGMLAAIGIIIMSKQIHILLGIPPSELKGKEPLQLLAMLPSSILHENAHITEIGIACLLILILHSLISNQKIKKIPAPLIVLAVSIPLGLALHIKTEGAIANFSLVKVGDFSEIFKSGFFNVDFSGFFTHTGTFIEYVILFALIGSIESMLTVKAMDKISSQKKKSNANKDLLAIGIGNTISGITGGLPMISEVARSSANIGYGAKSKMSNFFHGLFLLFAVLFAVPYIEMIPNAALAAMLIFVGFKLAHPKEFKHMYEIGLDQLLIFCATIVTTLATDLLIGVGTGMLMEVIVNLFHGMRLSHLFKVDYQIENISENETRINVESELVFTNFISFRERLNRIEIGRNLTFNLSNSNVIDHSAFVALEDFKNTFENSGGKVKIIGHENHHQLSSHSKSTRKKLKHSKPNFNPN